VDVVELTEEVGKFGHWQLFDNVVLDQFNQKVVLVTTENCLASW